MTPRSVSPPKTAGADVSRSKPAPTPAKPTAYSYAVVHKHTLGSCRGRLTVSRSGVAFVPDKEKGDAGDAFTFGFNEFTYSQSDDELTIKSASKTYRFKAAGVSGTGANRASLQEVGDRIARLRRTSPAK